MTYWRDIYCGSSSISPSQRRKSGTGSSSERLCCSSYVAEDPESGKITDFVSFYSLDTAVLELGTEIHTAYLYYYASEAAFTANE
jgi:hypothetical protein